MLFGYVPVRGLPDDHLVQMVELVVEEPELPISSLEEADN